MSSSLIWIAALSGAGLIVVVTGIVLTRRGRPFSSALLNLHKLVDLAAVVGIGVLVYRAAPSVALAATSWTVVGTSALLCVVTFATGGVVSAMKSPPAWAVWAHRAGSWAAVAAAAWCVMLVVG